MKQHELVLDHLKNRGSLTALEALRLYGVGRLAAVVFDLKKDGHPIRSDSVEVEKAGGGKARVASYSLETATVPRGETLFGDTSPVESH